MSRLLMLASASSAALTWVVTMLSSTLLPMVVGAPFKLTLLSTLLTPSTACATTSARASCDWLSTKPLIWTSPLLVAILKSKPLISGSASSADLTRVLTTLSSISVPIVVLGGGAPVASKDWLQPTTKPVNTPASAVLKTSIPNLILMENFSVKASWRASSHFAMSTVGMVVSSMSENCCRFAADIQCACVHTRQII